MLTQTEADALIAMRKFFLSPATISIPAGADQIHQLVGEDEREKFLLDLWRGTIRLSKLKFQTRGRKVMVLVRLDINGAPHTNPDRQRLDGTHIHVYREGYEDKWAYPLAHFGFSHPTSLGQAFYDFCRFCRVENAPPFQEGLL